MGVEYPLSASKDFVKRGNFEGLSVKSNTGCREKTRSCFTHGLMYQFMLLIDKSCYYVVLTYSNPFNSRGRRPDPRR